MTSEHADHCLTILAVRDLARSTAFYRAAFNWPVTVEVPVYVEFDLPRGQRLGLYQREAFAANTGRVPQQVEEGELTATELYFHFHDLDAVEERIESAGARKLSERALRDWGDEAAYYADPDGNVLVVARPVKDGQ